MANKAIEEKLQLILDYIVRLDGDISELRSEMRAEFKTVQEQLNRIEQNQPEDIKATLSIIEKNTANLREDIDHLAEAKGRHEMLLNRLTKQ
ncbi:hypothetical protein CHCC14819_0488 [Bacillus licheniformis]|uniref:hypothetical protein n=1 Tax=Bacillus licheniformis TaxID=1402 RepID=UPI0011A3B138|nr:hypothetical protein [Bacillus licheniformis]TWM32292.1 hypothetical protein CHCC14819_0488 [Bacillus licheniformis]